VPGIYPGRTEHIHVKVQAPNSVLVTTQLFFSGVSQNARDGIYDSSLPLNITDNGDGTFNFVVPVSWGHHEGAASSEAVNPSETSWLGNY
jgi:hypothetical protein